MTVATALPGASGPAASITAIRAGVRELIENTASPQGPPMSVLTAGEKARTVRASHPGRTRDAAELVDAISGIEKLRNSLDALQAHYEVALRDERIREQEEAGLAKAKLGSGIGDEVALARGISPSRAMRFPPSMKGPLSPLAQKPSASSQAMAMKEKPS